jgi:phosphatidate cytidylyltransferase
MIDKGIMEKEKLKAKLDLLLNIVLAVFGKLKSIAPKSNLKKRILSSVILLLVAVYAIYVSQALFFLLAIAMTIMVSFEWLEIIKTAKDQKKWRLIGFFYILLPIWALVQIRELGADILLWMFFIVWTTDITAYFVGKSFGGPKLMPKVSPNKTWSGLIGGVVASMLIGFLSSFMFVTGNIIFFVIISGLLAVVEQLSDLIESKVKRIFKVKDSGSLIPGHGGLLDRMDGITLVAPVVLLLATILSSKFYL